MSDGGKGSGRRSGADDKAYADGWTRIFGNKGKENEAETKEEVQVEGDDLRQERQETDRG